MAWNQVVKEPVIRDSSDSGSNDYGTRKATIKIVKKIYKIYKIKIDFQKSNRFSKIDYPKSFFFFLIFINQCYNININNHYYC